MLSMTVGINMKAQMVIDLLNMVNATIYGLVWIFSYNTYWDVAEEVSDANKQADAVLAHA